MSADMSGTRVTAVDLDSGESETVVITDNYVVICDGSCYIYGYQEYKNGASQFWVKGRRATPSAAPADGQATP